VVSRRCAGPRPIYEPEGATRDYWRAGRGLYAAGFRAGDLVHNAFSYHMTSGTFILKYGAHAVGCTVFPAGTGQTEQQLQAIAGLKPEAYTGTPSFLRILVEKAQANGVDIGSLRKAAVDGEALPPQPARLIRRARRGGLPELRHRRPGPGRVRNPCARGPGDRRRGGRTGGHHAQPGLPAVRFGTGDLSAILPGACPTGRTALRIKGWMGRADQTTKVRGMFVHPSQVADIARRYPQVQKARLVVSGEMANDQMCLQVEASEVDGDLRERIETAVRDVTKLRGQVEVVKPGSLPNHGKTIEDCRSCA